MKQVILLVLALSTLCYAQSEKSQQTDIEAVKAQVKELEVVIKTQKKQIRELQCVIKAHEAEIARLKELCYKAGVDPNLAKYIDKKEDTSAKSLSEITATVLSKPIFGIYLGEKISEVRKRFDVFKFRSAKVDVDSPAKTWRIQHHNDAIIDQGFVIRTFRDRVYFISVAFIDNSERNFKSLEQQLLKKYRVREVSREDFIDINRNFVTPIDKVPVQIYLHLEANFARNILELQYIHIPLRATKESLIDNRKQEKVTDDL